VTFCFDWLGEISTNPILKKMQTFKCRFKDHWDEYTHIEHQVIQKERDENKKTFKREENGEYGFVCPACLKPNRLNAINCTRCYFTHNEWDIQKLPSNVFLDIIQGRELGTPILYRDDLILIFDDKFAVSKNHIDVIPINVICDITDLDSSHIPLIEHMYRKGVEHINSRKIPLFEGLNIEDVMTCGFNFPVSVKHLHLHIMLPLFSHKSSFSTSRWHPYNKVLSDLKTYGKVHLYKDYPNDEEIKAEHLRAYKWDEYFENKKDI
jgi:diadenosine tetraphosphate (Ap4A) HIT family hydrolase